MAGPIPQTKIINIALVIGAAAINMAGFGTVAIMGPNAPYGGDSATYADTTEMTTAGYNAADPEVLMAASLTGQKLKPTNFKTLKQAADVPGVRRLTFGSAFVTGGTVSIIWQHFKYGVLTNRSISVPFNTSHAQTIADVKAALEAFVEIGAVAETDVGPGSGAQFDITIAHDEEDSGDINITTAEVTGSGAQTATNTQQTAPVTISSSLATVWAADNQWYVLLITSRQPIDIYRAAVWLASASGRKPVMVAQTAEAAILDPADTSDVVTALKNLTYNRVKVFHRATDADTADAAFAGRYYTVSPDSQRLEAYYLDVIGVTGAEYTAQQLTALEAKNCCYIAKVENGVDAITWGGKAVGGQWWDLGLTGDWFKQRGQERIIAWRLGVAKINKSTPFTDASAQQALAIFKGLWRDGVKAQHFARHYEDGSGENVSGFGMTAQPVANESTANRNNRLYTLLGGSVRSSGGIASFNVSVTLTT